MENFTRAVLRKRVTRLAVLRDGQRPSQFRFPNGPKTLQAVLSKLPGGSGIHQNVSAHIRLPEYWHGLTRRLSTRSAVVMMRFWWHLSGTSSCSFPGGTNMNMDLEDLAKRIRDP
jgi:hypothetical protein